MRIGPFGVWEIMIILIVVLLIFGPRRLPEMAKGLGQSVRAFRKEMRDFKKDMDVDDDEEPPQRPKAAAPRPAEPPPSVEPAPAPVDAQPPSREDADSKPV